MKLLKLFLLSATTFSFTACSLESSENNSIHSEDSVSINLDQFIGSYSGLLEAYVDSGFYDSMLHEGRILKDDTGVFYTDLTDEPIDSIKYYFKWRINQLVEDEIDTSDPIHTYKMSTIVRGDSFIRVFENIHKYPDTAKEPYFKHITRMIKTTKED